MKIKDKISGEVYEAETWNSWNGEVQYVKKGTNGPVRSGDDVEIVKEDKPKDSIDWQSFRREAAKQMLPITSNWKLTKADCTASIPIRKEAACKLAIEYADELIKQLKEEQK